MEIKRILVPVDGSEESHRAMGVAAGLAAVYQAELELLYVADLNKEMTGLDRVTMSGYIPSEITNQGDHVLAEFAGELPKTIKTEKVVLLGGPADQILEEQKEKKVDLIVMGSRGLGAVHQVIMGSVSQTVLHRAPCPVMIVK